MKKATFNEESDGMDDATPEGCCPVCHRALIPGPSVNRHHWVPKSRDGKVMEGIHVVCHDKIHSVWTEKELEREFNTPSKVRAAPEMAEFLTWIARKDPEFVTRHRASSQKGRRR